MPVNLRMILGTVNFNDYIRVSAEKVGAPGIEVWFDYFDVPLSNFTFIIPNLDPDNYYINFRDAANTGVLGTLVTQAFVNALTGEWISERRFYRIGSLIQPGATSSQYNLTDPYLVGRNITGVFKESFRYLVETDEFAFDATTGAIDLINGGAIDFSNNEVVIVEIKYSAGSSSVVTTGGHLFNDTISVTNSGTGSEYAVQSTDKFKRHSLDCSGAVQVLRMPSLAVMALGDYYYFEHKRTGSQRQSRILLDGTDKIMFNGMNWTGGNLLTEAWVSKGRSLYIRKDIISAVAYWEIILEYDGVRVGERMSATFKDMPNWLPEDGSLYDGDELPALWWWIKNVLPMTHYVIDDAVVGGGYVHPANNKGQFVIHSTLKKFRLPNMQNTYERGLKNFTTYNTDTANRPVDYPGGWQNWLVGRHRHDNVPLKANDVDRGGGSSLFSLDNNSQTANTGENIGDENRSENAGIIFSRHI